MPACLVPLSSGVTINLDKAIILMGRSPDCDVVLNGSRKVSRMHCCVAQVDNRYVVRDLGSMNGIRVNGERAREAELQDGDELVIGDIPFVVEFRVQQPARRPVDIDPPQSPVRRPRSPADYSQEYPVAISESQQLPGEKRETTRPAPPPIPFDPAPLELDSGEIPLRDLSDSGVR
jgi:pSer/pThr/pTyr-binding forkhead associated (FHA) protein